jgi:hypothetical protein
VTGEEAVISQREEGPGVDAFKRLLYAVPGGGADVPVEVREVGPIAGSVRCLEGER